VIASYRVILYSDGEERLRMREGAGAESAGEREVARRGVSKAQCAMVKKRAGELSGSELLRHRVRHFVDGTAVGTKEFLDRLFTESRERFGPRRKSGARKIRGCDTPLHALRDLRDGIG
jgi:hypothetical protein